MAGQSLTLRWATGELVVDDGSDISIGREPGNTVVLESTAVSRRHAQLSHGPDGWVFRDLGSTQGSFVSGVAVGELRLSGSTEINLGQGDQSVRLSVDVPVGAAVGDEATRTSDGRLVAAVPVAATGLVADPAGASGGAALRPGGALAEDVVYAPTVVPAGNDDRALHVEAEGQTFVLRPGETLTVGRDDKSGLVLTDPAVSRSHLRLAYDGSGWIAVDLGSSAGTWLDGERVERTGLSGEQTLHLGDRFGETVVHIVAPEPLAAGAAASGGGADAAAVAAASSGGGSTTPSGRRVVAIVAAAAVVIAAVAGGAWVVKHRGTDEDKLAQATVRIEAPEWGGSGTIIDAKAGLILTNAHVAAPNAMGTAVNHGLFADEDGDRGEDPATLTINVSGGLDKSAEPRYFAETVASDGYLDLAVLKITKTAGGAAITPEDLDGLVAAPLGDSTAVRSGDEITVLGYPGVADSIAPTLTKGVVSGVQGDNRMGLNNAWLNFDATSSHGNSGGLGANAAGELVGVPSLGLIEDKQAKLSAMRPIALALPLIEAARNGTTYTSPWTTDAPSGASIQSVVLGGPGRQLGRVSAGCRSGSVTGVVSASVTYTGLGGTKNTDMLAELRQGSTVMGYATTVYPTSLEASGCVTLTFQPLGAKSLPDGSYQVVIGVGGNYKVLYDGNLVVGTSTDDNNNPPSP